MLRGCLNFKSLSPRSEESRSSLVPSFFAVLIAVFVAAALVLGPASLARAAADSGGQAADQAA